MASKINTKLADKINSLLRWVDNNILPFLALSALGVLSANSVSIHLKNTSETGAILIGIAVASFLVIKSRK